MPRVRAVKSFVWNLRDIDVGDVFDVSERDAFLLVHGYLYAVPVAGEAAPAQPTSTAILVDGDPVVEHRDPVRKRRKS